MSRLNNTKLIYEKILKKITSDPGEWINYLKFASNFYKYELEDDLNLEI